MVSNSIIILAFHRVSDEFSPAYPPIPTRVFDKICKYLARNFNVIHPNQLFDETPSPKKKVLITFDDAYLDFAEEAYPILKKYNLPVLQHVITHCAETGESLWTQRLNKTIEAYLNENKPLVIPSIEVNEPLLTVSSIEQVALSCYKKMLSLKSEERDQIIQVLRQQLDNKVKDTSMLKWEELKVLQKDPDVVLGLHTHSHKNLSTLTEEELLEELNCSKRIFEKNIKSSSPLFLAFPNGQYNKRVVQCSKDAGYDGAFTCENKLFSIDSYNNYEIPRFLVYHTTWLKNWINLNRIRFFNK